MYREVQVIYNFRPNIHPVLKSQYAMDSQVTVRFLTLSWASQLPQDVPVDADILYIKAAIFDKVIN